MRLKADREGDALYLRLDETAIVESEEVRPGVILDFNEGRRGSWCRIPKSLQAGRP